MKKNTIYVLIGIAILVILLVISARASQNSSPAGSWGTTDIACLPGGHQNLSLHIHPELTITVDGVNEPIPGNIGINQNCMAEVHTHEADGRIHLEAVIAKTFVLGDFFEVWGRDLERQGYEVMVLSDGEEVNDPLDLELRDLQKIEIRYTSSGTSSGATATPTSTPTSTPATTSIIQ